LQLKFSVFNVALFTAESKSSDSICDDQWHSLEATLIGNVVKLVLDGGDPQYGSSQDTARNVTTSTALYVGGVPGKSTGSIYRSKSDFQREGGKKDTELF
jgi:hypothetical protein